MNQNPMVLTIGSGVPVGWLAECLHCDCRFAYNNDHVRKTDKLDTHVLCPVCTTPVKVHPVMEERAVVW